MNKKIRYKLRKFITLLVILVFIFTSTSIPSVFAYAKEIVTKQVELQNILEDNSQKVVTDIPIPESPHVTTDVISSQTKEQKL